MSESNYVPGFFIKGDSERVATTPAEAVSLVFQGYKRKLAEAVELAEAPRPGPTVRKFVDKDDEDKS